MARTILLVAALLATVFAGCASDESSPDPASPTPTATPTPRPSTPSPTPPPATAPAPPAAFELVGTDCRELLIITAVDAARAQPFVPENYTLLLDGSGQASAFAGLKICEENSIDGESIGNASTSDVGFVIEAPDGSDGFHYFQMWWTTNNPALAIRLVGQGWPSAITPGDVVAGDFPLPVTVGTASFDVPLLRYNGTADVAAPPLPPSTRAVGYRMGPFGEVTVDKMLNSNTFGGGHGTLNAVGSPLSVVLGADQVEGVGLWSTYDMTGTVGPI